jgi:HAD superfamily hydrolase (TIGR01458 family)
VTLPASVPILLDIDGVFHVSWEPIPGGAEAVARMRAAGHRLRFVTNQTIRPRAEIAAALRGMGLELEDEEVQTTPRAAAHVLAGKRVLALAMPSTVSELEGLELVEEGADAVLFGGCDEDPAATREVFAYERLNRAFAELDRGAGLYCMHKERWWQTAAGPLLDSGAFVAGLEYAARVEATVVGKPSGPYFQAALAALGAEAGETFMVGDDLEADIVGGAACGLRTVFLRTGKFRPSDLERSPVEPGAVLDSIADVPEWIEACVSAST